MEDLEYQNKKLHKGHDMLDQVTNQVGRHSLQSFKHVLDIIWCLCDGEKILVLA